MTFQYSVSNPKYLVRRPAEYVAGPEFSDILKNPVSHQHKSIVHCNTNEADIR